MQQIILWKVILARAVRDAIFDKRSEIQFAAALIIDENCSSYQHELRTTWLAKCELQCLLCSKTIP